MLAPLFPHSRGKSKNGGKAKKILGVYKAGLFCPSTFKIVPRRMIISALTTDLWILVAVVAAVVISVAKPTFINTQATCFRTTLCHSMSANR